MKRISLFLALALMFLSVTQVAYSNSYPLRYQLHWSPYKQGLVSGIYQYNPNNFDYNKNGLTYDGLRYSPAGLSYGSNSLVDRNARYSPYLFGYNKSGLIYNSTSDSYLSCGQNSVINIVRSPCPQCFWDESYQIESYSEYAQKSYKEKTEARKAQIEERKAKLEKLNKEQANDPSEAISEILKSKNIPYSTDMYLRMDGKTISVNFDIEDSNIIIKFWNSKEITEFSKNADKYKSRIYENYLDSWEDYYVNKIGNTKKVYNIIAGSKEEIFEKLAFNDNLKSDDKVYAMAKD